MSKVLITGGCGFAGHHLVEHILKNSDHEIIIIDKLTYASNGFNRLRDIKAFNDERVKVFACDLVTPIESGLSDEIGQVDYIVHMGAETHVDNSIIDPEPFIMSNVVGTMRLLEFAKTQKNLKRFIYFSTDEVFGPAPEGTAYKEWDRYNSGNPYSAAKAGGEELALAYGNTYGVPIIITHTMNIFGERQHPEKYIPLCIKNIRDGKKINIHANSDKTKAGSRFYIHGRNVASAVAFLFENGNTQDKFNIVGEEEIDNLTLARYIAEIVGKPLKYELVDFHSSRPGHDLRYALDGEKMKKMGWNVPVDFKQSLRKTVEWMLNNPQWL